MPQISRDWTDPAKGGATSARPIPYIPRNLETGWVDPECWERTLGYLKSLPFPLAWAQLATRLAYEHYRGGAPPGGGWWASQFAAIRTSLAVPSQYSGLRWTRQRDFERYDDWICAWARRQLRAKSKRHTQREVDVLRQQYRTALRRWQQAKSPASVRRWRYRCHRAAATLVGILRHRLERAESDSGYTRWTRRRFASSWRAEIADLDAVLREEGVLR